MLGENSEVNKFKTEDGGHWFDRRPHRGGKWARSRLLHLERKRERIGAHRNGTSSTISQVGAGYDSLIPTNSYLEDQCLQGCSGPSEIGNDITLQNTDSYQQLTSVVLAVRNWGPEISAASITLNINNTVDGPVTYTQTFDVPRLSGGNPTTSNLTFNLVSDNLFVQREFQYGFTFGDPTGNESALEHRPVKFDNQPRRWDGYGPGNHRFGGQRRTTATSQDAWLRSLRSLHSSR